jgi:hypothetical protein
MSNDLITGGGLLPPNLDTKAERFNTALKFLADKYEHFREQREFWTHAIANGGHVPELGGTLVDFQSDIDKVTRLCTLEEIGTAAKDIGGITTASVVSVDLNEYGRKLTLFLRNYKWAFWGDVNLIPYPYGMEHVSRLCPGAVKLALLELGPGGFMPDWGKVIKPALDAAMSRLFCARVELEKALRRYEEHFGSISAPQLSAITEPDPVVLDLQSTPDDAGPIGHRPLGQEEEPSPDVPRDFSNMMPGGHPDGRSRSRSRPPELDRSPVERRRGDPSFIQNLRREV